MLRQSVVLVRAMSRYAPVLARPSIARLSTAAARTPSLSRSATWSFSSLVLIQQRLRCSLSLSLTRTANYEYILLEKKDNVAVITLNRPKALNALCTPLFRNINAALDDIEADATVRSRPPMTHLEPIASSNDPRGPLIRPLSVCVV